MTEGNPFDGDVANGTLCRADKLQQCFLYGYDGLADGLTVTRLIVELMLTDIMIPFPRFVKQFLGVCQIEW